MKHRFFPLLPLVLITVVVAACSADDSENPIADMNALANEYLFLELSMGWHDTAHVDAYFGPEEIRVAANEAQLSLDEIQARALEL